MSIIGCHVKRSFELLLTIGVQARAQARAQSPHAEFSESRVRMKDIHTVAII